MVRISIPLAGLLFLCCWAAMAEAEEYLKYKDPKHPVGYLKYKDPKLPVGARIKDLMKRMTLAEKIGQMVQIERVNLTADVMKNYFIGSLLSGGGSVPAPRASPETWVNMVNEFQKASLATRLGIPMIYGIDAVHGHNNVYKATIFPHNVGLGVTRQVILHICLVTALNTKDPSLVKRIGAATALEVRATGIPYAFAPCIAVCRDPRWGRCYESYSEDHKIVQEMTEIIPGLQGEIPANSRKGVPYLSGKDKVVACAKHYVGDGGTDKGINENNTIVNRHELLSIHMPAYYNSIIKGVSTVMVSYSSVNGEKMHANRDLVTGFLKETLGWDRGGRRLSPVCHPIRLDSRLDNPALDSRLGPWWSSSVSGLPSDKISEIDQPAGLVCNSFSIETESAVCTSHLLFGSAGRHGILGFVISDWQGIDRITPSPHSNYTYSIQAGVLAGIDMVMLPYNYTEFIDDLTDLVNKNIIPMSRINDAVKRILRVKFVMGLFENPLADTSFAHKLGCKEHRELAREAVRKSLVLLKNGKSASDPPLLPLPKKAPKILVAGMHADNLGYQCGGWTIEWQGVDGNNLTDGTTILNAIKATVDPTTQVVFNENPDADFVKSGGFSYAIVVVGEHPYAETKGDSLNLTLPDPGPSTITNVCGAVKCVVIVISGRPVVMEPYVASINSLVAAWLPGSEGQGVADVLFGDYGFTGKLARTWFKTVDQLPMNFGDPHYDPLFSFGFGLETQPVK
ncbi:hypothetical protein HHK36_016966 [Tetracentron sinense]|uniref:Beta-glucosidase n=1 Tax=Tetracentron sinense TaxID=13715 RepID=A0A834Z293_TETSI|nr:hypothetical protein HHK36_016966 [Tetracentron sinense]